MLVSGVPHSIQYFYVLWNGHHNKFIMFRETLSVSWDKSWIMRDSRSMPPLSCFRVWCSRQPAGKVFHMTKQLPILSGESVTGFVIHHLVYAFFSPLFSFLTFAAWDYIYFQGKTDRVNFASHYDLQWIQVKTSRTSVRVLTQEDWVRVFVFSILKIFF